MRIHHWYQLSVEKCTMTSQKCDVYPIHLTLKPVPTDRLTNSLYRPTCVVAYIVPLLTKESRGHNLHCAQIDLAKWR